MSSYEIFMMGILFCVINLDEWGSRTVYTFEARNIYLQ